MAARARGGRREGAPEIISVHISCLHVFHNQQIGFHIWRVTIERICMKIWGRVYRIITESVHLFNTCLIKNKFDLFESDCRRAAE